MNKGTSQELRKNKALDAAYIAIDERTMLDMVQFTLKFSETLIFHNADKQPIENWKSFLLNDPAFVYAMIANVKLDKFNISSGKKSGNESELNDPELISKEIQSIYSKIFEWSELLKRANDRGTLIQEIDTLIESVNANNYEYPEFQSTYEAYENAYGNMVFIKEKAARRFEKEIANSNHLPHNGLFFAYLNLYKNVQHDINLLTQKHLDFYYLDLLQKTRKKQEPHTALIALQLQPGTDELLINEGDKVNFIFEDKRQYVFESTSTTVINRAEISELRTIYRSDYLPFNNRFEDDDFSINILYEEDILKAKKNWENIDKKELSEFPATLGEERTHLMSSDRNLTFCNLGIVVTTPTLILENGNQKISLIFKIGSNSYKTAEKMFDGLVDQEIKEASTDKQREHLLANKGSLKHRIVSNFFSEAFQIFITDKNGWTVVDFCKTKINHTDSTLTFDFELNEQNDKMISFDPKIHEGGFVSEWPCVKILFNNEAQYHAYKFLKTIELENIKIEATVSDVTNLIFSNSIGNLDNTIPFTPFGPTPIVGSYLRIQNPLILQRSLTKLELHICWIGLPQLQYGFAEYYREYPGEIDNPSFKAVITSVRNNINTTGAQAHREIELFDTNKDYLSNEKEIIINPQDISFNNKITHDATIDENSGSLFIVLTSPEMAFGHQLFAEIYADAAIKSSKFRKRDVALPKQPYTPIIEHLKVNYTTAAREVMLRKQDIEDCDVKLIHIYPFGHVQVFPGPKKSRSFLFPQLDQKGNLYIGLTQVRSTDIVSIGFELVPAVYIHTVINTPTIEWQYMANNEWEPIGDLLLEDTTNGLIRSGVVKIRMPKTIQYDNTRLPLGKFWIRATYDGIQDLNSKIKNVFTQAVALISTDAVSNDIPDRPGEIKIKKIYFESKKGIDQINGPFALEIKESDENKDSFYHEISDQLRHKNLGSSNWDIERLVLDRFKQIEKIRVYGKSNRPNELVKGSSVQIVLIPKNSLVNGTRKRSLNVDINTLLEVKEYVSQFVSPFVKVEVSNPVYEELKVRCKVKFNDIQRGGYLRNMLNSELVSYLSPDIEHIDVEKGFDEAISKTEILNFIESRPYVDFVTEFSVLQLVDVQKNYKIIDTARITDIEDLRTISAYAILTSAPEHQIEIVSEEKSAKPNPSGVGDLTLESDFVISDNEGNYI
ncbi:hypothetical protein [Aquipluma nitroreducens]|nr:hypothetical protein [Aquipluma nitroreducens]